MIDNPATRDARLSDVEHTVVETGRVSSLAEAAQKRGVPESAVIKTMVVRRAVDDYVFVLVPGDRVIDWPKLRAELGERRLSMPDAQEALEVTGYERGAITPFGSSQPWPVFADERLAEGVVSVGGGAHGVSITMDGADLMNITKAKVADLTKTQSA